MSMLLNYVGLANLLFFLTMLFVLINSSPGFSLKKNTISDLAKFKKTGPLFNLSLFIFSVGQVIFALRVSHVIANEVSGITIPLFLLGGLVLCLASIFTTKNIIILHSLVSTLSAVFVGSGVMLVSLSLLYGNAALGIVNFAATLLLPISFLLRHRLTGGYWELLLLSGIGIWNITLSIPLILP